MIIFVTVNLKKILRLKKNYPWPRPKICPNCRAHKVWGHGFLLAYFDEFSSGILIRRYRCPNCSTVIRMRPAGYLSRFQATIKTIRSSIESKVLKQKWLSTLDRTRQQHWFRGLVRRAKAFLGNTWKNGMVEAFDFFVSNKINPVTRSFKPEAYSIHIQPTEE
jgi:hypothetical protein